MISRDRVRPGMPVMSASGSRYGKVLGTEEDGIRVRHGRLLPLEFVVPYSEATEREGAVWLTLHGRYMDEENAPDGMSAVSSGPASRK